MTVENQIPIQHFTANGSTTVFAINFVVKGKDNIKVTVNSTDVSANDYSYEASLNAVVFNTAPVDGVEVVIERVTSLDRSVNYQTYNNSFRPETLNYDLDRIWHVLQEQNIVDAEILARIKEEIEWRRTHDFSYDELAKVRDLQIFESLKQYLDTIVASTSPNIFGGITAGVVFALDHKSIQTHLNELYEKLDENRKTFLLKADVHYVDEKDNDLQNKINLKADNTNVSQKFDTKADITYVDTKLASVAGGLAGAYTTYDLAFTATTTLESNVILKVTNDSDSTKNGDYTWDGTSLIKSDYDPLVIAQHYTDKEVEEVSDNLNQYKLYTSDDEDIIPVLSDKNHNILIGYDTVNDKAIVGGVREDILGEFSNIYEADDENVIPVLTDADNKVLIGYDMIGDVAIIAGLEFSNIAKKPTVAEVNHFLFDGQSLSVGATATTILSNTQPYSNTTFNTSPRMDSASISVVPLVEQFNSPSSDGATNRGETPCSGAANYASRAMMIENGINPKDHVIFCSTAGHGGYRIDQLEKGTSWYNFLLRHVTEAKRLNAGKTYKVQAIAWVQGENDAVSSQKTSYAIYKEKLQKLQSDVNKDIKELTGQSDDIKFITYQLSYASATWSDQALAQLHLVQESDHFALSTPMYHVPYAIDNIHLTNVGYKWMGAYFGRAYKQLVIDNKKPDFINPITAKIQNNKIIIKFDVPKKPLVLDVTTLATTTDLGFKVLDASNIQLPITDISVFEDEVHINLSTAPTGDIKVRYALDYKGTGLTATGLASGNLRDSTTDTITINNTVKPLYHVAPHFELTAYFDKGI